jgi:hypothetical protein
LWENPLDNSNITKFDSKLEGLVCLHLLEELCVCRELVVNWFSFSLMSLGLLLFKMK